jgi:hypothetical protein
METTHFQEAGLVLGQLRPAGRQMLLTVDFEAFDEPLIDLWCHAMTEWGNRAEAADLRFCHFVSVEHAARLRARHPRAHERFLSAFQRLFAGGSRPYPHSHCVFDRSTGEFPGESSGWPQRIPGYRSRASVFYDVVHRHNRDFAEWLSVVTAEYDRLLTDAEVSRPTIPVFRPGGWDHGSSSEEMARYVEALARCGYRIDSSDTSGTFGERTWRVGRPFGQNAYQLINGVIELAPSWSLTGGTSIGSRQVVAGVARLVRQPRVWITKRSGTMVTVLHFDHLFHDWSRHDGRFAVQSASEITSRIGRLMAAMSWLRSHLDLATITFDEYAADHM